MVRPLAYAAIVILAALVAGGMAYAVYPLAGDDAVIASGTSVLPGPASVGRITGHVVIEGVVEKHGFVEVDGRRYPVVIVRGDDGRVYEVVLGARTLSGLPGDVEPVVLFDVMMKHRVRIDGLAVNGGSLVIAHSVSMMCDDDWMDMREAMSGWCMHGMPGGMGPMGGGRGMPGGGMWHGDR